MLRKYMTLAIALVLVVLAGCRTAPIMNVSDVAVVAPQGKTLTDEQVRSAIIRAGSALGWQMADEGPNMLVGTLIVRSHQAVVEIPFSAKSYSIKYRSSVNLNASGGTIHTNYNGWIQNLNKGINTQLALL